MKTVNLSYFLLSTDLEEISTLCSGPTLYKYNQHFKQEVKNTPKCLAKR